MPIGGWGSYEEAIEEDEEEEGDAGVEFGWEEGRRGGRGAEGSCFLFSYFIFVISYCYILPLWLCCVSRLGREVND